MEKCLSAIVTAAMFAVFGIAAPAQDASTIQRAGKHYRVVFHTGDLPVEVATMLVDEALQKVEALWPILVKLVGARGRELHEIHLYRDNTQYLAAERKGSPFAFPIGSFVAKAGPAHVRLWPELPRDLFVHTGLPQSTAEDLLRVAAKQVITPLVPDWDADNWMLHVVVMGAIEATTNPEHAVGVSPGYDSRRALLVRKRQTGRALLLEDLLNPNLNPRDLYTWEWTMAQAAVLAEALAERSSRWARKLMGRHKMPKGHASDYDRRQIAVSSVVGKDWPKAEIRFGKLLQSKQALWEVRRPLWMPKGDRFLLVGAKDHPASIVTVDEVPPGDYFFAGRLELGPGRADVVRFAFGWDEESLVAVMFEEGQAWISEWDPKARKWRDRAEKKIALEKGKPFAFRVEVDGKEIRAAIDGNTVCTWAHGGREVHKHLAIDVNDRIVWIENFRIATLSK